MCVHVRVVTKGKDEVNIKDNPPQDEYRYWPVVTSCSLACIQVELEEREKSHMVATR